MRGPRPPVRTLMAPSQYARAHHGIGSIYSHRKMRRLALTSRFRSEPRRSAPSRSTMYLRRRRISDHLACGAQTMLQRSRRSWPRSLPGQRPASPMGSCDLRSLSAVPQLPVIPRIESHNAASCQSKGPMQRSKIPRLNVTRSPHQHARAVCLEE